VPPADNHHRHALVVPTADSEASSDDQSLFDAQGSTGRELLGVAELGVPTKYDRCEVTRGKELAFLDRKRFSCQSGNVMKTWGSTSSGCSSSHQRGYAKCIGTDRENAVVKCDDQSNHKTSIKVFQITGWMAKYVNNIHPLDQYRVG
jgi:hypothetical protein